MSERRLSLSFAAAGLATVLVAAGVAIAEEAAVALRPGEALERELAADETHVYRLPPAAGRRWLVAAEQRGIDLMLTLLDGAGVPELRVDSPTGLRGLETLLVPEGTGERRLEVAPRRAEAAGGGYRIHLEALDDEAPEERRRLAAEAATTRAGAAAYGETAEARRRAAEEYHLALEAWRELGLERREALAMISLAALYRRLDEAEKALDHGRRAVELWRALGEVEWQAHGLVEMGLVRLARGEVEAARPLFEEALQLHRAAGSLYGESVALSNLCMIHHSRGELRQALPCYRRAHELLRRVGGPRGVAAALHNLGSVEQRLGEPDRAAESFRQALELRRQAGDQRGEANTLNSLAVLHREVGEWQPALDAYGRALEVYQVLGDRRREAGVLSNMGMVYLHLGEVDRARSFLERSLPLRREVDDRRGEAVTLDNLGTLASSRGDLAAAADLHRRALSLAKETGDARAQAISLEHLGGVELALGDGTSALATAEEALERLREVGDRRGQGLALLGKGQAELLLGAADAARASLLAALEAHREVGDRPSEWRTLAALARAERRLGRPAEARRRVESALELLESLRVQVVDPHLRASFLGARREAYELQVDLLMELAAAEPEAGHQRAALEVSERARARTLLELVQEAGAEVGRDVDPELLERQAALERRLRAKAQRQMAGPSEAAEATALEAERYTLLGELEQLEAEIRRRSPRYAALVRPRPLEAAEIQALLDPGTVLLEYALGEERSFLWKVTRDAVSGHVLPGRARLEAAARRAWEELSTLELGAGAGPAETALDELSDDLLAPVAAELGDARLVVVADGALHYLPFGALRPLGGAPLLERHEVVHLPSASALAVQRRQLAGRPPAPRRAAVLADPVFDARDPRVSGARETADEKREEARSIDTASLERLLSSRREAEAIAALAPPGEVLSALGFEANLPTVFGDELRRCGVVHFATHGLIDAERPELSGLVLSLVDEAGRPREGFLRLRDVYDLRLGAELVVLSGCRTALGREIRGEGLVGLTRGFMYAGVPRVVASLWRVQDRATAVLMERFYRALWIDGLAPAAALRAAQLSVRRERRWRAPYFWAAFVLQGDWR